MDCELRCCGGECTITCCQSEDRPYTIADYLTFRFLDENEMLAVCLLLFTFLAIICGLLISDHWKPNRNTLFGVLRHMMDEFKDTLTVGFENLFGDQLLEEEEHPNHSRSIMSKAVKHRPGVVGRNILEKLFGKIDVDDEPEPEDYFDGLTHLFVQDDELNDISEVNAVPSRGLLVDEDETGYQDAVGQSDNGEVSVPDEKYRGDGKAPDANSTEILQAGTASVTDFVFIERSFEEGYVGI